MIVSARCGNAAVAVDARAGWLALAAVVAAGAGGDRVGPGRAVPRADGRRLAGGRAARSAPAFAPGDLIVAAPGLGRPDPARAPGRSDPAPRSPGGWTTSASGASGRSASAARARRGGRRGSVGVERRFGALTVRRVERPAAAVTYDFVARWADARVSRRRPRAAPPSRARWPAIASSVPDIGFNFVRRQIVEVDTRLRLALLAQPVGGATVVHRVPGRARSGASWWSRPGCTTSGCARRRRDRSTCAVVVDGASPTRRSRPATKTAGRCTGSTPRRRAGQIAAVRFEITSPAPYARQLRASPRRRASEAPRSTRAGSTGWSRARWRWRRSVWLLAVEGRQGFGRDEGQYFRAGERYWGWFEELAGNLAHGETGRSFTRAGDRSVLERQRARSPGRS